MSKFKSLVSVGITTCMLSMMLAGCGGQKTDSALDESSKGNVESKEKIELKVACYSDPFEIETVEKQANNFMEKYPNINVKVESLSGDFWQVLQTRFASQTEADVFYMDSYQSPTFSRLGVLEPLDAYIEKNNTDIADFEKSLLDIFVGEDGKTYGIPKDYSTLALFYDKALLEEKGLVPPKTWDELEEVAKQLTTEEVVGLSLLNKIDRFQPFLYAADGGMMENGKPVVNTLENAEGLSYYVNLLKSPYADTPQNLGVGWNGDSFGQGLAAMTIEGNWMISYLKEIAPELDYGVVPIPTKENGPQVSMAFTCAYSMSKNSKNKDEAYLLLDYLTSKEAQLMVAEEGRAIPSRISMGSELSQNFPIFTEFVEQAKYASPYVYGPASAVVVEQINKAAEELLILEDADVNELLQRVQNEIDKALK